jgi:hypothetical protein
MPIFNGSNEADQLIGGDGDDRLDGGFGGDMLLGAAGVLAIAGEAAIKAVQHDQSRPHALLDAAPQAWIQPHPEDDHSRALRCVPDDLNKKGVLLPRDGV